MEGRRGYTTYDVRSGRDVVSVQEATTPHEALIAYLRARGCRDSEMRKMGRDAISWRGSVYRAVPRVTWMDQLWPS